jgi:class 3 adenylate cyclase/predicted ATPase
MTPDRPAPLPSSPVLCASCGAQNPEGKKFCGECGAPLRATAPVAELRQITVVFCDLVGSTALAEQLDPEDLRELTGAYHDVCSAVIDRHEGHIAQYLGDGLLVYFGYPRAHEDDPRRAVRAGLEILRGMETLNARLSRERGLELAVRIGIHTGPVVVGEVGAGERRENLAMGRTPNLAARLQSAAEPGTVIASGDTQAITRGFFEFESLGPRDLRGLAAEVPLFRVVGETDAATRVDVARRIGLTPLTGRAEELAILEARWSAAVGGVPQTVLVRGEAGIGKSRLTTSLRDSVAERSARVLECICSPYTENSSLYPVIAMLERALGFSKDNTAEEKRQQLEARLTLRGIMSQETSALMGLLLSIPPAAGAPPLDLTPQKQRERTLEVLQQWLFAVADAGPVLFIVEDLHWADPTTLEFVRNVVASAASEPLLTTLTFRPEFESPWTPSNGVTLLALERLPAEATSAMVARVAHGKSLPDEVVRQVIERTEGVPLFIEEVTKAVLDMGVLIERDDRYELAGPLSPDLIPATVQGSLIARLDRLGRARPLAQLAATIGREFRLDVLSAVATEDDRTLRDNIAQMIGAELVFEVSGPPDETYAFKHALIQEAAYQTVLKKSRRDLHGRIAHALSNTFPNVAESRPELVAEHLSRAEQYEDAARQWLRAGQQASARAAYHEAAAHIRRGIAAVEDLPAESRRELELDLYVTFAPAISQTKGWAAPELDHIYARASELVQVIGNSPHLLTVLSLSFAFHFVAGRVSQSLEIAKQVLAVAEASGVPMLLQAGYANTCVAYLYHGELTTALARGEAALPLFNLEQETQVLHIWGQSSMSAIYCYLSEALWMLGYPDRAVESIRRGRTLARELQHLPSLNFAMSYEVEFYHLLRDARQIIASADESLRIAREEKLAFWEPVVMLFKGSALGSQGQLDEGVALMREGLARYHATGNGVSQSRMLAVLAESLWNAGYADEAFASLERGMELATRNGEHFYEPELYRLRGEFLLAKADGIAEARASMQRALEIAQGQCAKSLELRALMSIYRLDRSSEARNALATVYGSFTEGFETADLRDARALLNA